MVERYNCDITELRYENENGFLANRGIHGDVKVVLESDYVALEKVLQDLKRGSGEGCWCSLAIGDPRIKNHSDACKRAQAMMFCAGKKLNGGAFFLVDIRP